MHTRVLRVKIYTAARACFSVHSGIPLSWSTGARASTDRPCPSHSRDTDTLHVPTLPSRYATLMSVQCVVEIATRLRTPTMHGKAKSRDTRATNCEAGTRDQRTSSYLRFLVGVVMHPWVSRTSVFLAGYFTQTPFHTFLHKHNTCTLHSGQDFNTDT